MESQKDEGVESNLLNYFLIADEETYPYPTKGSVDGERGRSQFGQSMSSGTNEQGRRLLIVIEAR
jgi:hypothetical protein